TVDKVVRNWQWRIAFVNALHQANPRIVRPTFAGMVATKRLYINAHQPPTSRPIETPIELYAAIIVFDRSFIAFVVFVENQLFALINTHKLAIFEPTVFHYLNWRPVWIKFTVRDRFKRFSGLGYTRQNAFDGRCKKSASIFFMRSHHL